MFPREADLENFWAASWPLNGALKKPSSETEMQPLLNTVSTTALAPAPAIALAYPQPGMLELLPRKVPGRAFPKQFTPPSRGEPTPTSTPTGTPQPTKS